MGGIMRCHLLLAAVVASSGQAGNASAESYWGDRGLGSVIFMDNTGLNIVSLDDGNVRHVIDFQEECLGRGIAVDTSLGVVLWACDDRKLHMTHYNAKHPVYEDLTVSETYLKTGVVTDDHGIGFFAEYVGYGWRVYEVDLVTGVTNPVSVLNVLADQDYGGGLTYHDHTEYLSYFNKDSGSIDKTAPGKRSTTLENVKKIWESNDEGKVGYPCELEETLILPEIFEGKETLLYRIDITDIHEPVLLDHLHLPAYDLNHGVAVDGNRQPAVILTDPSHIAYVDGSKLFKASIIDPKEPSELVLDLGTGNTFGPIAFIHPPEQTQAPPTQPPPTQGPPTRTPPSTAPDTLVPPTVAPTPAPSTAAPPTRNPWVDAPFDSGAGNSPFDDLKVASPVEEKKEGAWPFGNGAKWPFVVAVAGILACLSGLLALLLTRSAGTPDFAELGLCDSEASPPEEAANSSSYPPHIAPISAAGTRYSERSLFSSSTQQSIQVLGDDSEFVITRSQLQACHPSPFSPNVFGANSRLDSFAALS